MLKITNLTVALVENKKIIVSKVTLDIKPGEIHLLNGNNGSGKSTLVNTVMGNPSFKIEQGEIELINENYLDRLINKIPTESVIKTEKGFSIKINDLEPNERSLLGLYLASQYPTEIPGVGLSSFLRLIYNTHSEKSLSIFKFKAYLEEQAIQINYPKHLLDRNLNEGFSGGEKKKTEILQMLLLKPRYILLDEIDSGLDRNSVKEVFSGISKFKEINPKTAFIIITHYDKVQEYLKPDFIHEMQSGELLS